MDQHSNSAISAENWLRDPTPEPGDGEGTADVPELQLLARLIEELQHQQQVECGRASGEAAGPENNSSRDAR